VELPRLEPLYQKYRDQGLSIIAIDGMADTERAQTFIAEKNLTYNLLENGEGDADVVGGIFGVRSYPTSYLIDGEGRVLFMHVGFEEGDEAHLEQEIQKVLAL
jgi:peroxiredoxin